MENDILVTLGEIGIYLAYILAVVGVLSSIGLPLVNALSSNPKSLMKFGLGIAILLVVFLISWGISNDEVTATYTEFGIASGGSKLVGGALITMDLLLIAALAGIVYTEVSKLLK